MTPAPAPPAAAPAPAKRRKRKPRPIIDMVPTVECGPDRWTITFPAPAPMISVNSGRQHWRRTSPIHKTWREAMFVYAGMAKLPRGLARVRIDVVLRLPRAGRADIGNYYTHVVKPLVDGLGPPIRKIRNGKMLSSVGYGLIPDDTAQYLDGPHYVLGEPIHDKAAPFGQAIVTITKVDPPCSAR